MVKLGYIPFSLSSQKTVVLSVNQCLVVLHYGKYHLYHEISKPFSVLQSYENSCSSYSNILNSSFTIRAVASSIVIS